MSRSRCDTLGQSGLGVQTRSNTTADRQKIRLYCYISQLLGCWCSVGRPALQAVEVCRKYSLLFTWDFSL